MIRTDLPPVRLEPGWYWYHFIRKDVEKEWDAFKAANQGVLKLRTQFSGDASTPIVESLPNWVPSPLSQPPPAIVVVFELVAPLAWTLPGIPSKAPKKAATTLKDISSSSEVKESPSLQKLIADAGGTVTGALSLLLWGGAAVLLFNLFRSTRPDEEPDYEPSPESEPATEEA
jgi:hypothetical protein